MKKLTLIFNVILIFSVLLHPADYSQIRKPFFKSPMQNQWFDPANPMNVLQSLYSISDQNTRLDWINELGGTSSVVCTSADYTFMDEGLSLVILNTSEPANSQLLSRYRVGDIILDIELAGTTVFIGTWSSGIIMLDVSDPGNPGQIAQLTVIDRVYSLQIADNFIYATGQWGLNIIDIQNMDTPALVSVINETSLIRDFKVTGSTLYLSDAERGFIIFDISNPADPIEIGAFPKDENYFSKVWISDHYAYLTGKSPSSVSFRILDVNDPGNITESGSALLISSSTTSIRGIHVAGEYAYILDHYSGLIVVDISDPAHPEIETRFYIENMPGGFDINGHQAYIATYYSNLQVLDINNPLHPEKLGDWKGPVPGARAVDVGNLAAYVATYMDGIRIFDVTDPGNPIPVSSYVSNQWDDKIVRDLVISGNYAFLATGVSGLRILDLSNPFAPFEVGSIQPGSIMFRVKIEGNYAYVSLQDQGFSIIDISNPAQPRKLGSLNTSGNIYGIDFSSGYAFAADYDGILHVVNIADPDNPQEIASISDIQYITDVKVSGNYAYIVSFQSGGYGQLRVADISTPANPSIIKTIDMNFMPQVIHLTRRTACIGGFNGMQLFDISEPDNPKPVSDIIPGSLNISDIMSYRDHLYVTDVNTGFVIYQIHEPIIPIIVANTNDSGSGSLREAIDAANHNSEPDSIIFNIPVSDPGFNAARGVWTIKPQTPLPLITDDALHINGISQTHFAGDLNPVGPEIQLDGSEVLGSPSHGLFILSGKNTIQGLLINRFHDSGILLSGPSANDNLLVDNYIGVNAAADDVLPNGQYGVYIAEGARNSIGLLPPEAGSQTNALTKKNSKNLTKQKMQQASSGGGNLIAGNVGGGIYISGEVANNNMIFSNDVMSNYNHGITLKGSVSYTQIYLNTIAYNTGAGIMIDGDNAVRNTIVSNAITANTSAGIVLNGGNDMLPAPVIESVTDTSVTGTAPADCLVQLFGDPDDEGEILLGETISDETGRFTWTGTIAGTHITATTTDMLGNTSGFSTPVETGLTAVTSGPLPDRFTLYQNTPNPFNPSTIIRFQIPELCFVSLKVYDLLGRKVETLVNEYRVAGSYAVEWNAGNLPSGIYICRMKAGTFTKTRKLVLQK